jgi:predicted O-methyltransferase YrrM
MTLESPSPAANALGAFPWAEDLFPQLLKSPWWIGHIPFAFELVARLRPRVLVELGTYSGSSFAAFCQAMQACGVEGRCYGIDLWEGDVHMGKFDETLYREIAGYLAERYPHIATLVRKEFNAASSDFTDGSIDLLHIDGTHTFEAVSNDFYTWLPKMSERGVVLFHDVNVNVENTGPSSAKFGVKRFFDSVKGRYPHFEFVHCWGLGVLVVGNRAPAEVLELVAMSQSPGFAEYFAAKGGLVSKRFEEMGVALPVHSPYVEIPVAPIPATPHWRRAIARVRRMLGATR